MSRTARSISTSVVALCLASLAWGDTDGRPVRVATQDRVLAYVPCEDVALDEAVLRGVRAALAAHERSGGAHVVLRVGRRATTWSNAAPEAVRLIREEGACLLIAPPERRVAHLLAQVGTRIQVPVISTCGVRSVGATGSTWVSLVEVADGAAPDATQAQRRGTRAVELALLKLSASAPRAR